MTTNVKTANNSEETTEDAPMKVWHVTFKRYEYVRVDHPIIARTEREAVAVAQNMDDEGDLDYGALMPVSDGFEHDWSDAEANAV